MNNSELKKNWSNKFKIVPNQLSKIKEIPSAATAFNANIDAILKINGHKIQELLAHFHISLNEIKNIEITGFRKPEDVLLGIVKCFTGGIAEEWVTEDIEIYKWMEKNLGYNHLQMGGQGGIIANVLALLGVQKVVAHTNSHPQLQAEQFLNLNNLYGIDDNNNLELASKISRGTDCPLIHWIIEFDKDDSFIYNGQVFRCPKSNRFIATYDPLNINLVMNKGFISYLNKNKLSYLFLSGFNPLLSQSNGINHIKEAVKVINLWKKNNPQMIIHLEIASTQDKLIRKAILDYIAPISQSAGLNERETIDLLEITGQTKLAEKIKKNTTATNLFDALLFLKKYLDIPRIQLHMFGLYLTIQDDRFPFTAEENLKGMMTASVVSSSKAFIGALEKFEDVAKMKNESVSDIGLNELYELSEKLGKPELLETGICLIDNLKISAIPTILVDKPRTLVGMGDTISSVSLLAGR